MGSKAKNKNKNKPNKANEEKDERKSAKIITDPRFAVAHTDPRFSEVRKRRTKVEIDSRFKQMFTDPNFASSKAPFDKRGKPKKLKEQSSFQRYYELEEDEKAKKDEEEKERRKEEIVSLRRRSSSSEDDDDEEEEEDEEEEDKTELGSESASELELNESGGDEESSTDDDDEVEAEEGEDDEYNKIEEDVPQIEKETHRLAVVNLDWRHVKAVDLYVTLSSFLPKNGQISSVAVYPSEFGLQRMKEEELHGPVGLFDDENQSDDEDGDEEIDNEKLRRYELSRLRYYYAVVECDSSATADYLYKACDGVEYERSANVLDLRFIPDSMEFKHPPRDVATEAPANYKGLNFQTGALQQSKVHLSWDEDESERVRTLNRKFGRDQLAELELKEFLASDESESESESESDDDENENAGEAHVDKKQRKRDMYRALLQLGDGSDADGKEDGQDMEVTFNTGLEDLSKRILEKKDKKDETVWEAYLRKKREKKKARKNKPKHSSDDDSSDTDQEPPEQPNDFFVEEPPVKKSKRETRSKSGKEQIEDVDEDAEASRAELELLLADDKGEDTGLKGYKIKPKKPKGKKGKEVPDETKIPTADYDDPRFSSLFTSPLFALDPTDPQFKRSAAYARQLAQRQHKHDQQDLVERGRSRTTATAHLPSDEPETNKHEHAKSEILPSKNEKHELSSLVRSVKAKSQQVQLPPDIKRSKKDEKLQQPRDTKNKERLQEVSHSVQSSKKAKKMK